jgi:hypothetical protein
MATAAKSEECADSGADLDDKKSPFRFSLWPHRIDHRMAICKSRKAPGIVVRLKTRMRPVDIKEMWALGGS